MRTPKFSLKIFIVLFFITFLGGLFRWLRLAEPKAVVFDEIYYALDAQSLLQSGVEKVAIENPEAQMLLGDTNLFFNEGAFVAHPPTGKWLIALGQYLFGFNTFGWRFSSALFGTLLIILTFLVARRLLKSNWFALFAASLVALDGLAIVMSRIALLDGFLTFFVLLAVLFLLKDLETSAA
ncbi:MAG: phospholipid carrier-dependent glycosyltransferase, partial [Candidatus Nanopelagicales bacterium]